MHEYPCALRIIKIAGKYAASDTRVTKIRLTVGKDSGLVAESIRFYFDEISAGTVCAGAELEFDIVTPLLRCKKCGGLFERRPFSFRCDREGCDGEGEPTEIGREFIVDSITVESELYNR